MVFELFFNCVTVKPSSRIFPVRLEQAKLVGSLLYGTRAMLVLNLPAFENKKCTIYNNRFHGNGPYGEIPTMKELIRTLGFTSRLLHNWFML